MKLTINGVVQEVRASHVDAMVEELSLPAPLLLIELNGRALRRADWADSPVQDGDRIEILRISAGG